MNKSFYSLNLPSSLPLFYHVKKSGTVQAFIGDTLNITLNIKIQRINNSPFFTLWLGNN